MGRPVERASTETAPAPSTARARRGVFAVGVGLALGALVLGAALPVRAQQAPAVAASATAAASASAPAPAPAAASISPLAVLRSTLAGRYSPVPGAPNAANRDAGVQRAVDALLFLIRPIAFGRIVDGNPVFPSLTIAFPEGMIEVQSPPVTARSPDTGAESSMMGLDRERNRLVQRLTAGALVQTSWNEAGSRTTRFIPSGNGRLILQIEVSSPRLPVPVRYTMAYQRN